MAKKLFKYPFNDGLCYDQDHFGSPIELLLQNKTKLFDLVGSKSLILFLRLNISFANCSFLKQVPSLWEANQSFHLLKNAINSLNVLNNVAEQGIKLYADFNVQQMTKSEDEKQQVFQVVEENHGLIPGISKQILAKDFSESY